MQHGGGGGVGGLPYDLLCEEVRVDSMQPVDN